MHRSNERVAFFFLRNTSGNLQAQALQCLSQVREEDPVRIPTQSRLRKDTLLPTFRGLVQV